MTISAIESNLSAAHGEIQKAERELERHRLAAADPATAAKRQARVDVVTISDTGWLDNHTARFIRLGRRAMPNARFHLLHMGEGKDAAKSKAPNLFDSVKSATAAHNMPGYLAFNVPRYGLCELFGLDEVVYFDPDVDIVADVSHILDDCAAPLGWCRSPIEPKGFAGAMGKCRLEAPKVWANSGTLVMRDNFSEQYAAAAQLAVDSGVDPRMVGNFSFSVMLASGGIDHQELPYKYGSIWWDGTNYARALCLHYCNDKGKARRLATESVWVW